MVRRRCSWKCFATGLLITTLLFITLTMLGGLVAIPVVYVHYTKFNNDQFAIVFAVEPDHANVFLYQWDGRKINNTGVVKQLNMCRMSYTSGGITTMSNDTLRESLHHCLHQCICSGTNTDNCLPVKYMQLVSLYSLSTRELYTSNKSDELTASLAIANETISNFFNHHDVQSAVLSESKEAVASWTMMNRIHFWQPNKLNSTTGVLYLGVASAQMSHKLISSNSSTNVFLYGRNYSVHSDCRWCNGVDELWKLSVATIIRRGDQNVNTKYKHACLPSDYSTNATGVELSSLCSGAQLKDATFHLRGTGEAAECLQIVDNLVNSSSSYPHGDFVALGKFSEVMNFFNTSTVNSTSGWGRYNDTVEKFCAENWSMLTGKYNVSNETSLSRRCFEGQLVRSLLIKGYRFGNGSTWSINFTNIHDTDESTWSLGYMLEQTGNIQSTGADKRRPYSTTSLVLSLVELVILLVLFTLFLISVLHVSCCDKNRNGYIAIS